MSICPCGYWWADLDEDGRPITSEYCHYDGPEGWAPCVQDEYNKYANEADIEASEAEEEAAYEEWLESLPIEQRPTNAKERVEAWKYFQMRYE